MPARIARLALHAASALTAAAALAACGSAGGRAASGAELRITRDFGQRELAAAAVARVREGQTVLAFLREEARVELGPGSARVRSIAGVPGPGAAPGAAWSWFVNGSRPGGSAASRPLAPGEVIQWDFGPADVAERVPAIVGAYPEPFRSGFGGRRVPVRVECADAASRACRTVKGRLLAAGAAPAGARLNTEPGLKVLRVIVAPWRAARTVQAAAPVERGPKSSGVFARFAGEGRRLVLLDPAGRPARTAPPGTGLVAATQAPGQRPVWVVTGVDSAGVERAAHALDPTVLRDAYAVAATPAGPVDLPLRRAR